MYTLLAQNGLWFIPPAVWYFGRQKFSKRIWMLTGLALGLFIGPASEGLYSLYWFGGLFPRPFSILGLILCFPLGMIGLIVMLFHGGLPYDLSIKIGLVQPATVVEGISRTYITIVSGVVWGGIYGSIGAAFDFAFEKQRRRLTSA